MNQTTLLLDTLELIKLFVSASLTDDMKALNHLLAEDGVFNREFKNVFMIKLKYLLLKYPVAKSYYNKGYSLSKLIGQVAHQFIYEECEIKNFLEVMNDDNFDNTITTEFDANNEIRTKLNKNELSIIVSFSFENGKIKSLEFIRKTLTQKSLFNQMNNN